MNNTVVNVVLVVCAVLVLLWPLARAHAQPVPRLTAQELAARIETREPLLLIDVRTPGELTDGVIAGIRAIPMDRIDGEFEALKAKIAERPETGVVLICRSGARATRVAGSMIKAGFAKVVVLDGGMLAWKGAGFPTVAPSP
jgi:rhodanese-related sulfurtransferase